MNKVIKYIVALSIVLTLWGCSDLLKEDPIDRFATSTFFQSMESYDAVVTAAYTLLTNNAWDRSLGSARVRSLFAGADDWTTQPGGNKYDWKQGDILAISSGDVGISNNGWALPYDVILQSNYAIDNIELMISQGFSASQVNQRAAEAYFLRAWGYFWLVRLYGGVPIVTDPYASEEKLILERSPVNKVYDRILLDLDFAIKHLPLVQSEYGRVNNWAAKILRAKVYLTMAGWPLKQTDMYAKALDDASDLIENSPYALEPFFEDIFSFEKETSNTEHIWQLVFCSPTVCEIGKNSPFNSQTTKPVEIGGFQDLFIEKSFYKKFPKGARKSYTFLEYLVEDIDTLHIEDTANLADNNLVHEVYGDTNAIVHQIIPWQNFAWQHPFLSKFYSGSVDKYAIYTTQKDGSTTAAGLDFPMYRITEAYLIYAEAQAMGGGGNAATALEYLNKVRRRAKGVDIETPDSDDLTSFTLDDVIDERAWEFVGEMKRWFDLTRTEKLAEALADRDSTEIKLVGDPSNKNLYYHPIPDEEIRLNPRLTQNPR